MTMIALVLLLLIPLCASILPHGALCGTRLPPSALCASRRPPSALLSTPEELIASAERLREEVELLESSRPAPSVAAVPQSPPKPSATHRLALDFGREEGTWMDARWGLSGRRIECTADLTFGADGSLSCAPFRLRGGFDTMPMRGGASYTVAQRTRLAIELDVEGTAGREDLYGDVSIPQGMLYVTLGCAGDPGRGGSVGAREGVVCVKQRGWHTGWWREENRIAGTARIKAL